MPERASRQAESWTVGGSLSSQRSWRTIVLRFASRLRVRASVPRAHLHFDGPFPHICELLPPRRLQRPPRTASAPPVAAESAYRLWRNEEKSVSSALLFLSGFVWAFFLRAFAGKSIHRFVRILPFAAFGWATWIWGAGVGAMIVFILS